MDDRVYGLFTPIASWPVVALLFVAFVICAFGFQIEAQVLGHENKLPDARFWYTPVEIRDLFDRLEERGRKIYAATAMTLDVIFPLAYGGMFMALIGHVYRRRVARVLVCIPVLTVAADLTENSLLAYYAWNFDQKQWPLLIGVATMATAVKWLLFSLSLLVVGGGGFVALAEHSNE